MFHKSHNFANKGHKCGSHISSDLTFDIGSIFRVFPHTQSVLLFLCLQQVPHLLVVNLQVAASGGRQVGHQLSAATAAAQVAAAAVTCLLS